MKLIIVRRAFVLLLGIVIAAIFLSTVNYVFNPIAETFKNSLEYQRVERQLMKKYKALQGKLEFSLPEDWTTMEEAFSGGEIVYHRYFLSPDKKIHGFVQVWDIKQPLKDFLQESKSSSAGAIDFKYYRMKDITVDDKKGYLVEYSRKTNDDKYIKAYEAFLEGYNGRIYRVSFYVDEENWKPQYIVLFNRIIRSLVIQK